MVMNQEQPEGTSDTRAIARPEYGVLDFNAPATIGIVLYESQLTRGQYRDDLAAIEKSIRSDIAAIEKSTRSDMALMEKSIRADMAKIEQSIRSDMALMEKSIRSDMEKMEKSLREEIGRFSKHLSMLMVTLNGITLSSLGVIIALF